MLIRKMTRIVSLALAAVVMIFGVTVAQAESTPATLTVSAVGTVSLEADYATLTLGVTTAGRAVTETASANAAAMEKVIAALTAAGVDKADMKTQHFQVNPITDYRYDDMNEKQTITGFQVSNTIYVTIRKVDQVGAVVDAAMAAGANESYGLTFRSSKEQEAADEATKLAVMEAKRKAALLAEAAGQSLGQLLIIQEGASVEYAPFLAKSMVMTENATPMLHGSLEMSSEVTLTFQVQP